MFSIWLITFSLLKLSGKFKFNLYVRFSCYSYINVLCFQCCVEHSTEPYVCKANSHLIDLFILDMRHFKECLGEATQLFPFMSLFFFQCPFNNLTFGFLDRLNKGTFAKIKVVIAVVKAFQTNFYFLIKSLPLATLLAGFSMLNVYLNTSCIYLHTQKPLLIIHLI